MVVSQTPLRVSFFGGGTDLREYYSIYGGAVLSATINKYIYVIVNFRHDDDIVLNYSEREKVQDVNNIKHKIIREALKLIQISKSIEITSFSDIHACGSGLGSSSAFTVGLLNSLYAYLGEAKTPYELAELACQIEIEILGEPIGKQDQFAAAFGGIKRYVFNTDESVDVKEVTVGQEALRLLNDCTCLYYTGITRKASSILNDQKMKINDNIDNLNMLKEYAIQGENYLINSNIQGMGELLNENWERKKMLSNKINNDTIESIYELGKKTGAYGGKLLGAGGGGYFLFMSPQERLNNLRNALQKYKEMPFSFGAPGSRIVFNNEASFRYERALAGNYK